jgi:hypothetical protein
MPRDTRVNIRLDEDVAARYGHDCDAIGSTPAGVTQMLIRYWLGDIAAPPPRPTPKPATTQEPTHA